MNFELANNKNYVNHLCAFVEEYSFLFNFNNINFFTDRVWEKIPLEWLDYLSRLTYNELNTIPVDISKFKDIPDTLRTFFLTSQRLNILQDLPPVDVLSKHLRGINAKKEHELLQLGNLIHEECQKVGVDRIVDIGCGLGHLLNYLNTLGNYELIGLEADANLCHAGKGQYEQIHFNNIRISKFTETSELKQIFANKRTALISLHGCGNLQPLIFKSFIQLLPKNNPILFAIACCYHKMTLDEAWPLSDHLKSAYNNKPNLPIGAFRLACQERMSKWVQMPDIEHERHRQAFLNRALVECIYKRIKNDTSSLCNFIDTRRINRRLGSTFDEVLRNLLIRNNIDDNDEQEHVTKIFWETVAYYKPYFEYIEPYTSLQFSMQGILESLILIDRMAFLHENGRTCELRPVFTSLISPRNMCLISRA